MTFLYGQGNGIPLVTPNVRFTQPITYEKISLPLELPVSLELVKEQLVIDSSDTSQDSFLTLMIESARDYFEEFTGRILINTEFETYRTYFTSSYELRRSKLVSLNSFQYLNTEGVWDDIDSSIYYITKESTYSRIITNDISLFPDDKADNLQSVKITFTAGYGLTDVSIPSDIKIGLLNHIAQLYANRGDCSTCDTSTSAALPANARSIYNKYRILSFYGAGYREGV